jgi:hypothetical protein
MQYIEPIVNALKGKLPPAARKRLACALALTMGTEAVLALRDVACVDAARVAEISAWAAQALMRQAMLEADDRPQKPRSRSHQRIGR